MQGRDATALFESYHFFTDRHHNLLVRVPWGIADVCVVGYTILYIHPRSNQCLTPSHAQPAYPHKPPNETSNRRR